MTFTFYTFQDSAGRWRWQREGRNPVWEPGDPGHDTQDQASAAALACADHEALGRAQLAALHQELCPCETCQSLDKRHPREGRQLAMFPAGEGARAVQQVLL